MNELERLCSNIGTLNIRPYKRLCLVDLSILSFACTEDKSKLKIDLEGISVNMRRNSLVLFNKYRDCVICGLEGNYLALENNGTWHLNLWAYKDDKHTLMTKDHILPLSRGGKDHIDNLQVLCVDCNHEKDKKTGDELITFVAERLKGPLSKDRIDRLARFLRLAA